jgi:hypothetical protein
LSLLRVCIPNERRAEVDNMASRADYFQAIRILLDGGVLERHGSHYTLSQGWADSAVGELDKEDEPHVLPPHMFHGPDGQIVHFTRSDRWDQKVHERRSLQPPPSGKQKKRERVKLVED